MVSAKGCISAIACCLYRQDASPIAVHLYDTMHLRVLVFFQIILLYHSITTEARPPFLRTIWKTWKQYNQIAYRTQREEILRERIFYQNFMFTRWHNERFYLGLETYTTAINKFADLTLKEFADQHLMRAPPNMKNIKRTATQHKLHDDPFPDSFDWRKDGYVTPVKDQVGKCLVCFVKRVL